MTEVVRLKRFFTPTRYDIQLKPNKQAMSFNGRVKIVGELKLEQQYLRLHSKDLEIVSAKINGQLCSFKLQNKIDELQIKLPANYHKGYVLADISFKAKITKPMHGIYPCYGPKGEIFIATQLESHYAREVFPCIDEPAAKAVFGLTLTAPKSEAVLANTLPVSSKISSNAQTVTFADTPPMPTYLLAFVIGNLHSKQSKTKDGILVRAWAPASQIKLVDFSLDITKKSLEFFNNYLKTPYPLPKLDIVALPDFEAAAMENWGLMTFRESCMLVDEKNTPLETKQSVATIVAHEIAHQWFGNLVTMRWWNDLWLNEGFASWLEYYAVDKMFPQWHLWTQFLISEQLPALRSDAIKNTHAIEVKVPHPDEIRTIFDNISYAKGACMVHMLHEYLGDKAFRSGLIDYLSKHAYGNSGTADLWKAFERSSGLDVKNFMAYWTATAGFPLVTLSRRGQKLTIKQSRFSNGLAKPDNQPIWPVPLLSNQLNVETLDKAKIVIDTPKNLDDFRLNNGQSGFYITLYWPKQYERLGKLVANNQLEERERLRLLSDMLALTKSARLPLLNLVKFIANYHQETSAPVWDSIAIALADIRRIMGPEVREAIKPLMKELTDAQVKRLGFYDLPKESYYDKLLRPTILVLADVADNNSVIETTRQLFDKAKKVEDMPKDIRDVILASVSRRGDSHDFDKMLGLYRAAGSAEDKFIIAQSLTNFRHIDLNKQALSMITTSEVRLQDAFYWIVSSLANPIARDLTWRWIKHNWRWIKDNFGSDVSFTRLPVYVAVYHSDARVYRRISSIL